MISDSPALNAHWALATIQVAQIAIIFACGAAVVRSLIEAVKRRRRSITDNRGGTLQFRNTQVRTRAAMTFAIAVSIFVESLRFWVLIAGITEIIPWLFLAVSIGECLVAITFAYVVVMNDGGYWNLVESP